MRSILAAMWGSDEIGVYLAGSPEDELPAIYTTMLCRLQHIVFAHSYLQKVSAFEFCRFPGHS